jgi:hypothetical protein
MDIFPSRSAEAIAAPSSRDDPSCERRSRAKRLTFVNRSTRLGKRIDELRKMFTEAVAERSQTPTLALKVEQAAQKTAVAELARGRYMRGEGDRLEAVMTAERLAERAVKALGLTDDPEPKASVLDNLRRAYPAARLGASDR